MERVFATVLNLSATGSIVILAVLAARLLLRGVPKKWSYLLWSVAGFRLACPVSFGAVFSAFAFLRERTFLQERDGQISTLELLPLPVGGGSAPAGGADWTAPPVPAASPAALPDPVTIAAWVWLAGMAVLLLYGAVSYARTRRALGTSFRVEGNLWQSEAVRSPFILGLFRPRIYIPLGLDGEELRYVLAHERFHLRHGDHLVRLFAFLLLAVHWFNPLCWLGYALCGRDMEMRCDEAVLYSENGIRKAYSRTLLSFAEGRRFPRPSPLAFGEASVRSRIQNALRWKRPKVWATALAAALCVAVIAACGANPASGNSGGDTEPAGSASPLALADSSETRGSSEPGTADSSELSGNPGEDAFFAEAVEKLSAYPDSYEEIAQRTDLVVKTPDQRFLNGQLWENFWNSVQHGVAGGVLAAQSTVEGDPILQYLSYDGHLFHYFEDVSRDAFYGGEPYWTQTYRYLQRVEADGTAWFVLTDEEFTGPAQFQEWLARDYTGEGKQPLVVLYAWQRPLSSQRPTDILPTASEAMDDLWGLTLTARDVTPTGLTLVVTQFGGEVRGELMTGLSFVVERLSDGTWTELPSVTGETAAWNDLAVLIPSNGAREMEVDWSWLYGELPPGQYRIGKKFTDLVEPGEYEERMMYARFTVPDSEAE